MDLYPINLWDESRLAINAYEMYKKGWSLATTFYNETDFWNTKPPFVIWIEVASMKLFGVNVVAFRLPAILSAIILCISMAFVTKKTLNNILIGLLAGFVLATIPGFNIQHIARTGDYDIFLCLFLFLYAMFFYCFIQTKQSTYIYLTWLCISLAVLTKSVAGLMILPALLVYILYKKELIRTLRNKHFYLGSIIFIVLVGGYYSMRESVTPGYLQKVYENELGGRYLSTLENHNHPWDYYISQLNASIWIWVLPIAFIHTFFIKQKQTRDFILLNWLIAISYLATISYSATKLLWYIAPFYVFISLPIAYTIYSCMLWINEKVKLNLKNQSLKKCIIPLLTIIVMIYPFKEMLDQINGFRHQFKESDYPIAHFLIKGIKGEYDITNNLIYDDGYNPQIVFYQLIANEKGIPIEHVADSTQIKEGDKLIIYKDQHKEFLEKTFDYKILKKDLDVVQYEIIGRKPF